MSDAQSLDTQDPRGFLRSGIAEGRLSPADVILGIESEITSGRLPLGSMLPGERALALAYGVSRPLVREALRNLVGRGLLEVRPGRGTFVTGVTGFGRLDSGDLMRQSTARQVVEARTILESQAARLAAERASEHEISLMAATLERLEASVTPVERGRLDLAFHLTIARASRNPVVEAMLRSVAPLMVELMVRSIGDGTTARLSHPFHRECLEAIKARDGDRAEAAMAAHLRVADMSYGEGYDDPLAATTTRYAQSLVEDYGSLDALVEAVLHVEGTPAPSADGRASVGLPPSTTGRSLRR